MTNCAGDQAPPDKHNTDRLTKHGCFQTHTAPHTTRAANILVFSNRNNSLPYEQAFTHSANFNVFFYHLQVSGLPTPDLIWQLNGQTIRPDSAHKMLVRENGVHSLVIEPVTSRDAGIYTCIASNRAGQNSFNLELIVAGKQKTYKTVVGTCAEDARWHDLDTPQ